MTRVLILFTVLLLVACDASSLQNEVKVETSNIWINDLSYIGQNEEFNFFKVDPNITSKVYLVETEMELALLISIYYSQGYQDLFFSSRSTLDMGLVHSYAISINSYYIYWYIEDNFVIDSIQEQAENINKIVFSYDFLEQGLVKQQTEYLSSIFKSDTYTDSEKVYGVYSLLLDTIEYDYSIIETSSLDSYSYDSYGALIENTAVCQGYSMALFSILTELRIPNIIVYSESDNHTWNMIYLDGQWSFYDLTFDDTDEFNDDILRYYKLDKVKFEYTHNYDESTSTTLSYEDYLMFAEYVFNID